MFKPEELEKHPFIIAEVGQNHQGDFEIAKDYVKKFADTGVDAIKFQTRNNKYLFSECAYNKEYDSENAFAKTYGEHREKLELTKEELIQLKELCHENGVKFMSTPFDEPSLALLDEIGVDIIKIASFDLGNLPFLNKISKLNIPTVMSIGGGQLDQIRDSVKVLKENLDELAILHCVSEYPCEVDRLGLENIQILIDEFPDCAIGLSDHFSGTITGPIGYMKGARVFEKHVTLNRAWKGSDHSFALSQNGFKSFVRDIRRVPNMMGSKPKEDLGKEFVFQKLGKSIVAAEDLQAGDKLSLDNLSGKIYGKQYIPVRESNNIIGKTLNKGIKQGELISYEDLK